MSLAGPRPVLDCRTGVFLNGGGKNLFSDEQPVEQRNEAGSFSLALADRGDRRRRGAAFTLRCGCPPCFCVRGLRPLRRGARRDRGQGPDHGAARRHSRVADADARHASARSAGDARWSDLVHRPEGQSARAARSRHREGAGISFKGARFRPAWTRRGQVRSDMVHGASEGLHRQARSRERRGARVYSEKRGAHRSSHADLRQERRAVVHRARRQSDWAPRSVERRDRVAFPADEGLGALRPRIRRGRRALCRRIRRE